MAPLPCKDKFDDLEDAIAAYEKCYDEVDQGQVLLTLGGILTVSSCAAVLPAADSGSAGAFFKVLGECTGGASASFTGFLLWLAKLDECEALVDDALDTAHVFNKCAGEHKDVLNAAAAANNNS